jgi:glutathione S-transferase
MILVGQYDSPYTRRVAVSLHLLGVDFEHDKRSVFGDFDSMRTTNPLGRVPSLILDDGTTLIDSAAILDWLDQRAGPERALLAADGLARQQALQRMALATGTIDKVMGIGYERLAVPELLPVGRHPTLDAVAHRCEALPAFKATWPADYVVPPVR